MKTLFIALLFLFHWSRAQNSLKVITENTNTASLHKQDIAGQGIKVYIYETGAPLLAHDQFEKRAHMDGHFMSCRRLERIMLPM